MMSPGIVRGLVLTLTIACASSAIAQNTEGRLAGERWRDCDECPEIIALPAGTFAMGSPESEPDRYEREGPLHDVTIARPFAIGVYEVTRDEYGRFVRATNYPTDGQPCLVNDGHQWRETLSQNWRDLAIPQTGRHPAVCISWNDAVAYVSWLSERTGVKYRLPSAAEWEYAARAGTTTAWYWGDTSEAQCENANGADETTGFPWAAGCSDGNPTTSLVGSFRPNLFGVYDILGNAWEWVQDCYMETYVGAPTDGAPWEPNGCAGRAMRGASWASTPKYLRAAHRAGEHRDFRSDYTGFRVARTLEAARP